MVDTREPWWIIAGAAAALHGVDHPVADVDVLVGIEDAARLLGHTRAGAPSERFRSLVFGRIDGLPLPVEVMAGFALKVGDGWRPVRPTDRVPIVVDGETLFVPGRAALATLLTAIGRPKDLARAAMLTT